MLKTRSHIARRRRGFTLIELLVVIAIIGILAAILFPVFAKVREKGRQTACLSNLNQIGKALLAYVQDDDEALPMAWYGVNGGPSNPATGTYKWMDAIFPYVKSTQVFHCPDDSGMDGGTGQYTFFSNLTAADDTHYGSYAMNSAYLVGWWSPDRRVGPGVVQQANPPPPTVAQTLAKLNSPANEVWVADGNDSYQFTCAGSLGFAPAAGTPSGNGWNFAGGFSPGLGFAIWTDGGNPVLGDSQYNASTAQNILREWGSIVGRHSGPTYANLLYCDGHTKASELDALLGQNDGSFVTPFIDAGS